MKLPLQRSEHLLQPVENRKDEMRRSSLAGQEVEGVVHDSQEPVDFRELG